MAEPIAPGVNEEEGPKAPSTPPAATTEESSGPSAQAVDLAKTLRNQTEGNSDHGAVLQNLAASAGEPNSERNNGSSSIDPSLGIETTEIKGSPQIEFSLKPATYDETLLAANLASLNRAKQAALGQVPEGQDVQLVISSQVIYDLAGDIPEDIVAEAEDPSQITRYFLRNLDQQSPDSTEVVFLQNPQIRQVILDAILARLGQKAANGFDVKGQETIQIARELLRQSDFLSKYYIGSSSAILPGVEKAGGSLFSVAKLKEKGIARRTGEGMAYGAGKEAMDKSGISVTNSWEVANGYATLNSTAYHKTAEKAQAELTAIEDTIKEFEALLAQPEETTDDHVAIKRGLAMWADMKTVSEEQLQGLLVDGESKEPPFPVVFGFDELEIARAESYNADSFRVGHEIGLKTKLARIYVPTNQIDYMRQWLTKTGILQAQIYPLEAVNVVREVDPTRWRERENMNVMVRDANYLIRKQKQ